MAFWPRYLSSDRTSSSFAFFTGNKDMQSEFDGKDGEVLGLSMGKDASAKPESVFEILT